MSGHTGPALVRQFSRLRGRSLAELRSRSIQMANQVLERWGISPDVREPDDAAFWRRLSTAVRRDIRCGDLDGLLDTFTGPARAPFFEGTADRASTCRALRQHWPAAESRIVNKANAICGGSFDLLGHRDLSFGDPIDWHLDPITNRRSPRCHWSRIPFLDAAKAGDHKIIWELNRHQHFLVLGRAYWLTGDETYAAIIARHLESWMDDNPPKVGINWASSLELSFRSIAWIWALHFLRTSPHLTPRLFRRTLAMLDLHARHVESNLSTYFSPNTHLTGEALALFYIGSCFPVLADSTRWSDLGWFILERQLPRQVRPDGTYVEQSPYYQLYTADIYLHAIILARRSGRPVSTLEPRLQAALDCLMFLTKPDGTTPLIGDDDGGELFPLDERAGNDSRATLSTAAVLFSRRDYAAIAQMPTEEILWLVGPRALEDFASLRAQEPTDTSRAFGDGGFYVMRDGWKARANYLVIDAGPHGYLNGGHAHADALSVEIVSAGRSLLVDPGTYTYTGDPKARDAFRSTAAHNAVTVDGQSSSCPGYGPFSWESTAEATVNRWETNAFFDFLEGSHNGFERLPSPVRYSRSVLFLRERYWVIRDRIESIGTHDVAVHFHFAPDIVAETQDESSLRLSRDGNAVARLAAFGAGGTFELTDDWAAPVFGRRERIRSARFNVRGAHAADIVTFVVPVVAGSVPVVLERGHSSSRSFEILHAGCADRLLLAASGSRTDLSWCRFEGKVERLAEFVQIGRIDAASAGSIAGRLQDGFWHTVGNRGSVVSFLTDSTLLAAASASASSLDASAQSARSRDVR